MRTLGSLALWMTGCSCAVAVAWAGVSVVGGELMDPPAAQVVGGEATPPATSERHDRTIPSGPDRVGASRPTTGIPPAPADAPGPGGGSSPPSTRVTAVDPAPGSNGPTGSTNTTSSTSRPGNPDPTTVGAVQTPVPGDPPAAGTTTPTTQAGTNGIGTGGTGSVTTTRPATTTWPLPEPDPRVSIDQASSSMTVHLVGGTLSIGYQPGQPLLLWAIPAPGYQLAVSGDEARQMITVIFVGLDDKLGHLSIFDGWWDNGPHYLLNESHPA